MKFWIAAVLAGLAGVASPAMAQKDAPVVKLGSTSLTELNRMARNYANTRGADPCALGVPLAQELLRRQPDNASYRLLSAQANMRCSLVKRDYDAAYTSLMQLEELDAPERPELGLLLAELTDNADGMLHHLRGFLLAATDGRDDPDANRRFYSALRALRKANEDSRLSAIGLEMFRQGHLEKLQPDLRSTVATLAIDRLIIEDPGLAPSLVNHLQGADWFRELLVMRKYELLWPAVEQRIGPRYSAEHDRLVARARARSDAAPGDFSRLGSYISALRDAGRHADVVALRPRILPASADFSTIDEHQAWAINYLAYSLYDVGQADAANDLFNALAGVENRSFQVNFVINRGTLLAQQGRWAEALEAGKNASEVASRNGSDYAKGLIALTDICSLTALGRVEEARAILPKLRDLDGSAVRPFAKVLVCLEQEDEAVDILIPALADPVYGEGLVLDLQPPTPNDLAGELPEIWQLVARKPRLHDALMQYARLEPEEFRQTEPEAE